MSVRNASSSCAGRPSRCSSSGSSSVGSPARRCASIATRVAIDTHRRAGEPTDELPELEHLDGRPAHEELAFLTDALPPTERAAVVLRYGYDLDYVQIAAALDSSADAARQATSSGVRRLRRRLT